MNTNPIFESAPSGENGDGNASAPNGHVKRAPGLEDMLAGQNVQDAWTRVRRNQGCAGVDGVSIGELEPIFDQEWLQVDRALRSGNYRPKPLLRARIPKPSGGERLLGIPTVMDRVVQQAVAQVFAPCWEPRFSSRSFAYRPGRGARDALNVFEGAVNRGAAWVLHMDIEKFFDSVPHPVALGGLQNELEDKRLEVLVQRTLSCGVYEDGVVRPTATGLAQGSPLSPLLANVVLHRLDTRLESSGWEFARYADDCVVLLPAENLGPAARDVAVQTLTGLQLRLNESKTTFGPFTEARFLGFAFARNREGQAVRSVSPESLAEAEETLMRFIQTAGGGAETVAVEAGQMLRSWLAYFRTPHDEIRLRAFVNRILGAWRERYPGVPTPDCLCWEAVRGGDWAGERVDYSGHFQNAGSFREPVRLDGKPGLPRDAVAPLAVVAFRI